MLVLGERGRWRTNPRVTRSFELVWEVRPESDKQEDDRVGYRRLSAGWRWRCCWGSYGPRRLRTFSDAYSSHESDSDASTIILRSSARVSACFAFR